MYSQKRIDLPEKNVFIPKNLDLLKIEKNVKYPEKILETSKQEVWFKQDNQFFTPKLSISVAIHTINLNFHSSIENYIYLKIWLEIWEDQLREQQYLAEMAGLSFSSGQDTQFLQLKFQGYSETLSILVKQTMSRLKVLDQTNLKEVYEKFYLKKLKALQNFSKNNPYQQTIHYMNTVTCEGQSHIISDQLKAIQNLSFEGFQAFQKEWLNECFAFYLIVGNTTQKQVMQMITEIDEIFTYKPLEKENFHHYRPVNFLKNFYVEETIQDDHNSATLVHFQGEQQSLQTLLVNRLLVSIMKDPCFQQLRTEEQLGYIVFCYQEQVRGVLGINILVQSSEKSSHFLAQRIENFVTIMHQKAQNLTSSEFDKFKESLKINLLEKQYSIFQEANAFWHMFDLNQVLANMLDDLKIEVVLSYFEQLFIKNRKILEVHLMSNDHEEQNEQIRPQRNYIQKAKSISWVKKSLPLYPDAYAML